MRERDRDRKVISFFNSLMDPLVNHISTTVNNTARNIRIQLSLMSFPHIGMRLPYQMVIEFLVFGDLLYHFTTYNFIISK